MAENLARAHHQYQYPSRSVYFCTRNIHPAGVVYFWTSNIHPCPSPNPTCSLLLPTEDARCVNNGNAFQHLQGVWVKLDSSLNSYLRIGARALEPEEKKVFYWKPKICILTFDDKTRLISYPPVQKGISKLAQRPELFLWVHLVVLLTIIKLWFKV